MREPAPWLRTVAFSYPMLRPLGPAAGFAPAAELRTSTGIPILLTRARLDFPDLLAAQQEFVDAGRAQGVDLTVLDVADGHHGFDITDDTDQARLAIVAGLDFIQAHLR